MKYVVWCVMALATGYHLPAIAQEPVTVTAEGVLLDFQNADVRLVISALAEAAGLNVIYGELPGRPVTLRMNQPVPADELLPLLRNLAESNGLTVEEQDGLIRVSVSDSEPPESRAPPAVTGQDGQTERRLYVYRLRHAQAPRLAATLGSLFGIGGAQQFPGSGRSSSRPERTQRIPPLRLDREPDVTVDVGETAAPELPGEVQGELQIVPDELTNSLLVRATPADYEVIRSAIEALDLRPLQALIEVLILEVRRDRSHEVGVSLGAIDSLSPSISDRVDATLRGSAGGDFTLTVRDLGYLGVDAAVSLLGTKGEVRILSRPVVFAQNNQEARILIGTERPFIQVFRSLPTGSAIRDQIVQYRDVGTQLTIVPTINPDGYVNLDVLQEVSTATAETQFGAPVISTREAATRLFVKDGQSVVIGGLIDDQRDRTRTGIPILKDIPVLGYLFGTTRDRTIQSELFLFLTPHIIETDEDVDRLNGAVQDGTEMLPDPPEPLMPRESPPDSVPPDTTSSSRDVPVGGDIVR